MAQLGPARLSHVHLLRLSSTRRVEGLAIHC